MLWCSPCSANTQGSAPCPSVLQWACVGLLFGMALFYRTAFIIIIKLKERFR